MSHLRDLLIERDSQLAGCQAELVTARAALTAAGLPPHSGNQEVALVQEQLAQRAMQLLTTQASRALPPLLACFGRACVAPAGKHRAASVTAALQAATSCACSTESCGGPNLVLPCHPHRNVPVLICELSSPLRIICLSLQERVVALEALQVVAQQAALSAQQQLEATQAALAAALQDAHGRDADRDVSRETATRLNSRIAELVTAEQAARAEVAELRSRMERMATLHERDMHAAERRRTADEVRRRTHCRGMFDMCAVGSRLGRGFLPVSLRLAWLGAVP